MSAPKTHGGCDQDGHAQKLLGTVAVIMADHGDALEAVVCVGVTPEGEVRIMGKFNNGTLGNVIGSLLEFSAEYEVDDGCPHCTAVSEAAAEALKTFRTAFVEAQRRRRN